ncbi:protein of unknown function [Bradyrhizobium vignae]|uniref:Uncharacterized protein n=1 Tax=Bradyrhizobium vignae TaxID=1549949 RepID=A0A2U3PXV8_9BRAD|nr:protein of unknown function [Bradyrhizobium vignae]
MTTAKAVCPLRRYLRARVRAALLYPDTTGRPVPALPSGLNFPEFSFAIP